MAEHMGVKEGGAAWCKSHKPVDVISVRVCNTKEEAAVMETMLCSLHQAASRDCAVLYCSGSNGDEAVAWDCRSLISYIRAVMRFCWSVMALMAAANCRCNYIFLDQLTNSVFKRRLLFKDIFARRLHLLQSFN